MIPAVRTVAVPFYFLSWYEEPFTVLASLRVDLTVDDFNFGRITVGHIAAGFRGIVRHVPRRVELFV